MDRRRDGVYWIGGSPCAGKSSVARLLAGWHGLRHVECDAGSDARLERMAGHGLRAYAELTALGTCERLARPAEWQAAREIEFYHEQFDFLRAEFGTDEPLLVDGADLLPELLCGAGISLDRAIWIVPTPEFQLRHYSAREWVDAYLKDCPDPATAFENWMRRDMLFADHVRERALAGGGRVVIVDGSRSIEESARLVAAHFGL